MAQAYVPDRISQVQREAQQMADAEAAAAAEAAASGTSSLERLMARAQAYERDNDPARAIETLLSASTVDAEVDVLQQVLSGTPAILIFDRQLLMPLHARMLLPYAFQRPTPAHDGHKLDSSATCCLQVWWQAVVLAQTHQRHRLTDVASVAAQHLIVVGRPGAAGEVLQSVGDISGGYRAHPQHTHGYMGAYGTQAGFLPC